MKFELFNKANEVVVSADIQGVGENWFYDAPVVYQGDVSLLDWHNSPAMGEMVGSFFERAAHTHGLRYACDTIYLRAL